MTECHLTLETDPTATDLEIFTALREYNASQAGPSGNQSLTLFVRQADGAVVGGLEGSTSRGWLHVNLLVMRPELRRQRWGSRLLLAAEREAERRGCTNAYLETFSFQALPFYQKHGYHIFGTLPDYPAGHRCYFLTKRLTPLGQEQEVAATPEAEFERLLAEAEAEPFSGWKFDFLTDRLDESELSWDYRQAVCDRLPQSTFLLDMGTGGGEFLASLHPLPLYTCATEAYAPNLAIARARLAPLGISVAEIASDNALPFPDNTFDLVINRHESYSASEVFRILRPNGLFLTQQVGGQDHIRLNRWLQEEVEKEYLDWSLQEAAGQLRVAGFTIEKELEEFTETRYFDIGAIVYYLKAAP